jgi:hypothetical protein
MYKLDKNTRNLGDKGYMVQSAQKFVKPNSYAF